MSAGSAMSAPPYRVTPGDWLDCVLMDMQVGANAKVVAAALSRHAGDDLGCSASMSTIAILIGATDKTAKRGVKELLLSGWLRRTQDGGGRAAAEYGLTMRGNRPETIPAGPDLTPPKIVPPQATVAPPSAPQRLSPAELEAVLRRAGGREGDKAPGLTITGPIDTLIDEGYDLERQILPVIRAAAAKGRSWTTWRYFVTAIREQNDVGAPAPRTAPAAAPPASGPGGSTTTRSGERAVDFGGGYVWPIATVKAAIERWESDPSSWPHVIGPPPDEPGCRVPVEIYDPEKRRRGWFIIARDYFEGKWQDGWTSPKPGQPGFPEDIAAEAARKAGVAWPPPPGWRPGQR